MQSSLSDMQQWAGRIGKFLTILAGLAVILDLLRDKIPAWAERAKARHSTACGELRQLHLALPLLALSERMGHAAAVGLSRLAKLGPVSLTNVSEHGNVQGRLPCPDGITAGEFEKFRLAAWKEAVASGKYGRADLRNADYMQPRFSGMAARFLLNVDSISANDKEAKEALRYKLDDITIKQVNVVERLVLPLFTLATIGAVLLPFLFTPVNLPLVASFLATFMALYGACLAFLAALLTP